MLKRLVGTVATLSVVLGSAAALATDMYNGREPSSGQYSPYDDPRYADIYRHPGPGDGGSTKDGYQDYVEAPPQGYEEPRRDSYRDRYDEAPPPRTYTESYRRPYAERLDQPYGEPRYGASAEPCMARPEIRRHARQQGWLVLRWQDVTRTHATFVAERLDNGQMFDVTIDRCSARVLAVSPTRQRYEDYAWRRRVYDRPY